MAVQAEGREGVQGGDLAPAQPSSSLVMEVGGGVPLEGPQPSSAVVLSAEVEEGVPNVGPQSATEVGFDGIEEGVPLEGPQSGFVEGVPDEGPPASDLELTEDWEQWWRMPLGPWNGQVCNINHYCLRAITPKPLPLPLNPTPHSPS